MQGLDPDLGALQEVRDCVERARAAQKAVRGYGQAEIDRVCAAMAEAAAAAAHDLARLAVEETGIGRVTYKILKNLFASEGIWASIADEPTVGVISRDPVSGVIEVATPVGVVAGIVPTTNPTSTAIGKALIAVKGRNAIVLSPHPRAKRCIGASAEVLRRAIARAGGPPDLVQSLSNPTIESTGALMKHRRVALILATGGSGLVQAAYSSGKPAYGVGPGNVPAYVDRSADLEEAARWLVASQSFDNGTLCCSEQSIVLDRPIAESFLERIRRRGAHLCSGAETQQLERFCNRGGHMNPDIVGLDPARVAELAGFQVPASTTVLLAPQDGVGRDHPLSIECLCPLLSLHLVDGWREGCRVSTALLEYGGLGHTVGVWAREPEVLEAWFLEKPASRIIYNGPTSQGAVGYSTALVPSMSLGCGPQAGNITSDNISARHMVNIKRAATPRVDWEATYARDLARAGAMTGERAPRGSGLDGDPALGPRVVASGPAHETPSPAASGSGASNWMGNPPVPSSPFAERAAARASVAAAGAGACSVAPAAPRSAAAPSPSAPSPAPAPPPGASPGGLVSKVQAAQKVRPPAPTFVSAGAGGANPGPLPAASRPGPGPVQVGAALSAREIRDMMSQAGAGCPLGPCHGCPHSNVQTGACQA